MTDSAITFTSGEVSTYYAARVPHLKQRRAAEWRGACPIHQGKNDNFGWNTGQWFCRSTCGRGGDILELEAALTGGDFPTRKAEVFRLMGRIEPDYRRNGTRTNGNSGGILEAMEKVERSLFGSAVGTAEVVADLRTM